MVQTTVMKVDISCQKCKRNLLKAVTGLQGVDKVEVDDAKGILTVTGDADPYEVVVRTRKINKGAEVVRIGPPPPPKKADGGGQKKPEEKKKATEEKKAADEKMIHIHLPPSYPVCQPMCFHNMAVRDDPQISCSIL